MAELEELDPDELDELLGLKPKFDVPPAARRSLESVGILAADEGGLPAASLRNQPASIVRAALSGNKGPVVSRWGHILLRRALVSRLAAPDGMDPAEFAGLRAGLLNRMGEYGAAKTLAQDVDTDNWNESLAGAAVQSYISTGDIVGACPLARFQSDLRDDAEWQMLRSICAAYAGESSRSRNELRRLRSRDDRAEIDVLLAQRYAGAAGRGGSAVNLEWEGVDALSPWRFSLANAVGAEIPQNLLEGAGAYYQRVAATAPMLPLAQRIGGAELAAREGILSSAALIDLYSALYAEQGRDGEAGLRAARLREAYVGADPASRLAAIRDIWTTSEQTDYARQVLTAYAAARLPANADMADDASDLIASMLAAGLDRDALEWGEVVPVGSHAWALLALSQPQRSTPVASGPVDDFYGDDDSTDQRKTGFLVAGLAGLGRLETAARQEYDQDLALDLDRSTRWSQLIQQAAAVGNQPMVAMLAGVGMQGTGWDKMTARHLFHIVSALDRVGLSDEARMIAAEAVARG
ncbi:hypothetical protein GRI94_09945 [Erythrobacter jejuensis]|uniref:Uncharacterized protein n=1 Tax=Parerythrobacter jejuensis TaxID=795812 RepID=A0A845AMW2_9SPHN|nr:hypothetical protein [Parerythrobacter jejuensis]